ncbi:cysteine desulfurase [Patescibacteria group bacterium]|nr:cysteine desulfurase [Patescibacteria group bacterium]MBU0964429.1 cysteine desulfurase [Patescibacteria group bacterium]
MKDILGKQIKKDFPIFKNNPDLIFLDSAASTQKPQVVIDAIKDCYEKYYANVHRGLYQLSAKSSEAYEGVRDKVVKFINASSISEIIFTKNTTESINLVAYAWGRQNIDKGDEIILTAMEHHANIVPWQQLAKEKSAVLKFIPVDKDYRLGISELSKLLTKKTKLVAVTHMSNVLGTINPVKDIINKAKSFNKDIKVIVDGAQSVPHFAVDVQDLNADFFAFSSHKMAGPGGVGVLYAKQELLEKMPPFLTGGDMITEVTLKQATWNELPYKFEAGTPAIAEVIGLGAAIDYLYKVGLDKVFQHEEELTKIALKKVSAIPGVEIFGPKQVKDRGGAVAFTVKDVHPHDVASILDNQGVAVRAGNHCTQPLHDKFGIQSTVRASFYLYNQPEDIDALVKGINKVKEVFK